MSSIHVNSDRQLSNLFLQRVSLRTVRKMGGLHFWSRLLGCYSLFGYPSARGEVARDGDP
jgi:hypothetical protein